MNYSMTKNMAKELDSFLVTKTCTDVDRAKFLNCKLYDGILHLTTHLVFNCNCHGYEDATVITIEHTGAVIHLPAFWVEVPKELAYTYICDLINDIYNDTYQQWVIDGLAGSTDIIPTDPGCPCNPGGYTPII